MTTAPHPTRLAVPALRDKITAGADLHIIDVRTPVEFESGHIPGSYNVPLAILAEHREAICRYLNRPVVLVCRSGQRAGQAELRLAEAGVPHVQVLAGGLQAWQAIGAPVRRGRQRWDLERQIRLVAGSLVLGSIAASAFFGPAKWLAGAIGGGLTVAALTNTCLMGSLLAKLPYNRDATHDLATILDRLAESEGRQP